MNEGFHHGVAGLQDRYRSADRSRLGDQDRAGKLAQRIVVVGIAARQGLDALQTVAGFPRTHQIGRQRFQADGLRLQRVLELVEHQLQRRDENGLRLVPRGLIRFGELCQRIGEPPRRHRARPLCVAGGPAQAVHRSLQGLDILLIARRGVDGVRVERRVENLGALRDQLQFCGLVLGHKAVQRHDAKHFRQFGKPLLDLFRVSIRIRHHIDGVGAGVRILSQIEKGRDRLNLRIAQVYRIEVEPEEIKQRQAGERDQQRPHDNDNAMPLQKLIDRRQERISDRLHFPGGIEQPQQCRKHGDAGYERDEHASAGNLAEFRNAFVIGGQKTEEAGRRRHRGE